jgi:hypothetical protein
MEEEVIMVADFKGYQEQRRILELGWRAERRPYLAGGFAEDALLYHQPSREHMDIDWFVLRPDLDYYLDLARQFGFTTCRTFGNNASGEPFYLSCAANDSLWIDLAIGEVDAEGNIYGEIAELLFDTTDLPPFTPFRIYFDKDILHYPLTEFDGLALQTMSPLGLYQFRAGFHRHRTFGELRETDKQSMAALKARFFAHQSDEELMPVTEVISQPDSPR